MDDECQERACTDDLFTNAAGNFHDDTDVRVADEGGISLLLPGQFGSLAPAPQQPGWSFANINYHTSVSAGGDMAAARQFTTRAFTRTATVSLNASLNAHADLDFVSVNRVF